MLLKIDDFVYYRTIRKWLQTLNAATEANCRYDWRRADRIRMTSFLVEDKSSPTIMKRYSVPLRSPGVLKEIRILRNVSKPDAFFGR